MQTGGLLFKPGQRITKGFSSIIDWFFPPQCCICGKLSDKTPYLCEACYRQCAVFDKCPDSVAYHTDHPADHVSAMFYFDEHIQKLLHQLKYQDMPFIGEFLGRCLGEHYQSTQFAESEVLIPVPLYHVRHRERTYNQSFHIARGLASVWGIPVMKRALKRCRNTQTQTQLNKTQRQENIHNAFSLRNKTYIPERVCIIDDVFTTGATTMEAARILKRAGAKTVNILVVATPRKD